MVTVYVFLEIYRRLNRRNKIYFKKLNIYVENNNYREIVIFNLKSRVTLANIMY